MIVPVFKTGGRRVYPSSVGSTPTRFRHFSTTYRHAKSLTNPFGLGRAICTTLEWASCISFVTTSPYTFIVVRMSPTFLGARDATVYVLASDGPATCHGEGTEFTQLHLREPAFTSDADGRAG